MVSNAPVPPDSQNKYLWVSSVGMSGRTGVYRSVPGCTGVYQGVPVGIKKKAQMLNRVSTLVKNDVSMTRVVLG